MHMCVCTLYKVNIDAVLCTQGVRALWGKGYVGSLMQIETLQFVNVVYFRLQTN